MTAEELERYGRLASLQQGWRRGRILDDADAPPEAGPRDLTGLSAAMATAQNHQAYYFSHPDWRALSNIRQQVDGVLASLNAQAEVTPQAAIQAAKITTLAASLIARHAAKVSAHLDTWNQRDTPGGRAMRTLTRAAEDHAARASGLDSAQALDTPRLLMFHVHQLTKELRQAETSQQPPQNPGVDDSNDPELDSTLSIGAAADPELAEASQLMKALSELSGQVRRAGHRLTLDVRLHGLVETAQLRGLEMISGIAQTLMRRYDKQGRSTDGRRNIAAMIFHYAEQCLERMRGALGADERRDVGHYETDPPERYLDALFEESHTATQGLRTKKNLTPQERTDLQIRFLLAQRVIAASGAHGDQEWGSQPKFPPSDFVAGMQTDNPVENRLTLMTELRRRVENNPFGRDAQFLNKVADRLALEIAGPPELTDQALQADLTVDQVRAVATHVVGQGTVASPLVLSETAELKVTHAQAERALAILQTLNVVGPPNGLEPRQTLTVSRDQLAVQLELVEERLPNLLEIQKGAAAVAASSAAPLTTAAQPEAAPSAEAPSAVKPEPTHAPLAAPPPAPTEPATAPELPRRDRTAERRHPGNLATSPTHAAEAPSNQDIATLLEGNENQIKEVSAKLKAGTQARAAAHPAPTEAAPPKTTTVDEAQRNAQQAEPTVGVGVR
ncbi:hypothetical protein ACH419_30725 [Streptomyces bobili]|uniref:hypothetical protein n=1 Tax=Streptomyces bobili TaxID=67280 RepID=UPI00378D4C3F